MEGHLASCDECQRDLETLRTTVGLLRELPEIAPVRSFTLEAAPPAVRETRIYVWATGLATSMAALLLAALVLSDVFDVIEQTGQVSVAPMAARAVPAPEISALATRRGDGCPSTRSGPGNGCTSAGSGPSASTRAGDRVAGRSCGAGAASGVAHHRSGRARRGDGCPGGRSRGRGGPRRGCVCLQSRESAPVAARGGCGRGIRPPAAGHSVDRLARQPPVPLAPAPQSCSLK